MIYLDYDQEELDAQYNQATLVPDISPYLTYWAEAGQQARATLDCQLDIAYGPDPEERLDIFPAANEGAPIHIHVHGGAWKQMGKEHVSYPAPHFVAAGATYIALNFGLAPDYILSEIVDQVRNSVKWVWDNAATFKGDPNRIFISGVSSGAHLAANVLADGWRANAGLPEDLIKGAVLASGPFDLDPVRLSARNDYLKLDQVSADRNNPFKHLPKSGPKVFICWGDGELAEFQRQGKDFAAAWQAARLECESLVLKGRNHFDVGNELGDADSPVVRAALRQMGKLPE